MNKKEKQIKIYEKQSDGNAVRIHQILGNALKKMGKATTFS